MPYRMPGRTTKPERHATSGWRQGRQALATDFYLRAAAEQAGQKKSSVGNIPVQRELTCHQSVGDSKIAEYLTFCAKPVFIRRAARAAAGLPIGVREKRNFFLDREFW